MGGGSVGEWFSEEFVKEFNNKIFFSDSNKEKWNQEVNGIKCIPPETIKQIDNRLIIVTVSARNQRQVLNMFNAEKNITTAFRFWFSMHKESFLEALAFLDSDYSKEIYLEILKLRLEGNEDKFPSIYYPDQYFCLKEFNPYVRNNFTFVDVGAFVGDGVERFIYKGIGCFNKIYAFEPSKNNFNAMQERCIRLKKEWAISENKIQLENFAVGDKSGICYLNDNSNGILSNVRVTTKMESNNEMRIISLDDFFEGKEISGQLFIKVDIEGKEMDLLKGARNTILKYKPLLALCIYHKFSDFYSIAKYVKNLNSEYKMAIRHHSYSDIETVLYCYL